MGQRFDYTASEGFARSTGPWDLGLELRESVNLEDREDNNDAANQWALNRLLQS